MKVNDKEVACRENEVIMVEPGETHRVLNLGPKGCIYAVFKEKSYSNSKLIFSDKKS